MDARVKPGHDAEKRIEISAPTSPMPTRKLRNLATFVAPFALLLVLWAVLVPAFGVNLRIFPHLESVIAAGWEGIRDGSLIDHIWASLVRVAVGTALALLVSVPLGIAMGVSKVVSTFLTPILRFF